MASQEYKLGPEGVYLSPVAVSHRDDEYLESNFDMLLAMQERHFWYRGRHRFLLAALRRHVEISHSPATVDLGGGCGGWVRYLSQRCPGWSSSLALADSSLVALQAAASVLPPQIRRYQVDLMDLKWRAEWDIGFLLDVIEHLPNDVGALRQACEALRPGGLLFVTTPALPAFWSYNDELALHQRRYTREDLARIAPQAGLQLLDARYFMFLLSPLYWLARRRPGIAGMSEAQKRALFLQSHRIPPAPLNAGLTAVFAAETPLGHMFRFPWGTSILGVFRRTS